VKIKKLEIRRLSLTCQDSHKMNKRKVMISLNSLRSLKKMLNYSYFRHIATIL